MARKRHPNMRRALLLAFAAGTLAGAAGMRTLQRRQDDDLRAEVAGGLGETTFPPFNGRLDAPGRTARAAAGQQS